MLRALALETGFFVIFRGVRAHKHLPDACRVGLHYTDCASGGTCDCFRACERLSWFYGPSYCHNASQPATFTELLSAPAVSYQFERPAATGGFNIMETNDGRSGDIYTPRPEEIYGEPEACNYHGWMMNGRCSCFFDWEGVACERRFRHVEPCLGPPCKRCIEGVCEDPPRTRNATRRPAVYVYPLPPGFNQLRPRIAMERNTPYKFWHRLSRSEYETTDPDQASLFFLPVSAMGVVSHGVILLALRHVAETWPYFNASGGADHVVVCPWDFGCSWLSGYPEAAHVRFVSHWGLKVKSKIYANDCPFCGPSYVPKKDVVVPDTMEEPFKLAPPHLTPRNTLLFFSGSRSSALRTRVFEASWRNATGVRVLEGGGADLAREMDAAEFCLGLPGAGFGTRAVLAIVRGCIPVVVGDNIAQPFEDQLNWSLFSVSVPEAKLKNVYNLVVKIDEETRVKLREACAAHKHHFIWDDNTPDDAFETLLRSF